MNGVADTLERLARDALRQGELKRCPESLDPNKSLVGEYGLGSVGLINLVMAIEIAFDVQIKDDDLNTDNFESLTTIKELLEAEYIIRPRVSS